MKHRYIYMIFLVCLLIIICTTSTKESFIPQIKQFYKPYVRSYRTYSNNVIESLNLKTNNLLRKYKLV